MTQFPVHFHIAALYRLLKREYVDQFFETGALRLSSFAKFATHENEQQSDKFEGLGAVFARSEAGSLVAYAQGGVNAYVLCTTAALPTQNMLDDFRANAAFRVKYHMAFMNAIAQQIPGLKAVVQGHCNYRNSIVEVAMPEGFMDKLRELDNEGKVRACSDLLRDIPPDMYFRKNPSYEPQAEFRWLFFVEGVASEHIDICAPNARQFCEPWYPEKELVVSEQFRLNPGRQGKPPGNPEWDSGPLKPPIRISPGK